MAEQFGRKNYIYKRSDISLHRVLKMVVEGSSVQLSVPAGGTYEEFVYAPEGSVCYAQIMYIRLDAIGGAGSGTNEMRIGSGIHTSQEAVLYCSVPYTEQLSFANGRFEPVSGIVAHPDNEISQIMLMKDMFFDSETPLFFRYDNKTDVDNNQTMQYLVIARKQVV